MDLSHRFSPLMAEALHCVGLGEAVTLVEIQARLRALADQERNQPLPVVSLSPSVTDPDKTKVSAASFPPSIAGALPDAAARLREDLQLCRFAVCAWADELILTSGRADALEWTALSLQNIYFQTAEAGEIFFVFLDELLARLDIPTSSEAESTDLPWRLSLAAECPPDTDGLPTLQVFALCLLYGFRGRYHAQSETLPLLRKAARAVLVVAPPASNAPANLPGTGWRVFIPLLEPAAYVVLPLLVTFIFSLYCAAILSQVPLHPL